MKGVGPPRWVIRVCIWWGTKLVLLVLLMSEVMGKGRGGGYNWYSQILSSKVSAALFWSEHARPLVSMLEQVIGSYPDS